MSANVDFSICGITSAQKHFHLGHRRGAWFLAWSPTTVCLCWNSACMHPIVSMWDLCSFYHRSLWMGRERPHGGADLRKHTKARVRQVRMPRKAAGQRRDDRRCQGMESPSRKGGGMNNPAGGDTLQGWAPLFRESKTLSTACYGLPLPKCGEWSLRNSILEGRKLMSFCRNLRLLAGL